MRELDGRRARLLETFAARPIESFVVMCRRGHGVSEFEARARCLEHIVNALQRRSVERLVIESRQDDVDDQRTIRRHRRPEPRLVFEHRRGVEEPLLWIADGVAWEPAPDHAGGSTSAIASAASSRPEKRGTRLPNQRVGNRVHFPRRLRRALLSMRPPEPDRKPVLTRISPGSPSRQRHRWLLRGSSSSGSSLQGWVPVCSMSSGDDVPACGTSSPLPPARSRWVPVSSRCGFRWTHRWSGRWSSWLRMSWKQGDGRQSR